MSRVKWQRVMPYCAPDIFSHLIFTYVYSISIFIYVLTQDLCFNMCLTFIIHLFWHVICPHVNSQQVLQPTAWRMLGPATCCWECAGKEIPDTMLSWSESGTHCCCCPETTSKIQSDVYCMLTLHKIEKQWKTNEKRHISAGKLDLLSSFGGFLWLWWFGAPLNHPCL